MTLQHIQIVIHNNNNNNNFLNKVVVLKTVFDITKKKQKPQILPTQSTTCSALQYDKLVHHHILRIYLVYTLLNSRPQAVEELYLFFKKKSLFYSKRRISPPHYVCARIVLIFLLLFFLFYFLHKCVTAICEPQIRIKIQYANCFISESFSYEWRLFYGQVFFFLFSLLNSFLIHLFTTTTALYAQRHYSKTKFIGMWCCVTFFLRYRGCASTFSSSKAVNNE